MIYFDKCDFIRDSRGLVVGQVFLNTGITGFSVDYSSIEQPSEADGEQLVGLSDTLWSASNSPLMQFTGLKDINGREIYEGDVIRNHSLEYLNENFTAKVIFDEGSFRAWIGRRDIRGISGDSCEVIGNIYESPELLKNE